MTAAASYLVEISPTNADRTNVGGTANLGGTVQAAFASGSYATRAYTILSAAGGLNGTTFNALTTSNLPANFTASLSYTATDVILNLTATLGALTPLSGPNAPSACAFSINQCNVANAINAFFNNGGTLPPAFANIFGLTGVNLGNALSQLSGEAATGAQQAAFQLTNQSSNDGRRLNHPCLANGLRFRTVPLRDRFRDSAATRSIASATSLLSTCVFPLVVLMSRWLSASCTSLRLPVARKSLLAKSWRESWKRKPTATPPLPRPPP